MHHDLEHLIRLQALDLAIEDARTALASAKERKAANDVARRDIEKDRSAIRARRSKYSDQTMAVKTNKEFHALQHEMEVADREIAKLDDRDLELMVEGDEIAAAIKAAEAGLKEAERSVASERQALEAESKDAASSIGTLGAERAAVAARTGAASLTLFEQIGRPRKGVAMSALHGDLCSICHVHVRPHILQQVRRGDEVLQCENCHRILYFLPSPAPPAGAES
jgi:predicted  nucleic acid-binding Zn-ribbon protein